jgi:hypothetical protein
MKKRQIISYLVILVMTATIGACGSRHKTERSGEVIQKTTTTTERPVVEETTTTTTTKKQ